jgi:hypothetical protein
MGEEHMERKVTAYRKDGSSFSTRCEGRDITMQRIRSLQADPTIIEIEVKILETGAVSRWAPDPDTRRMEWTGPYLPKGAK